MNFLSSALFVTFLITASTMNAAEARHDGVMIDEYGLTIKLGEKPIVDERRWNLRDNKYSNVLDYSIVVEVLLDEKSNVQGVSKSGFGLNENMVYVDGLVIVKDFDDLFFSSSFCKQWVKKDLVNKMAECKKTMSTFMDDFMAAYSGQFTDDTIKKISSFKNIPNSQTKSDVVAHLEKISSMKALITGDDFELKLGDKANTVLKMTYGICSDLSRYSTNEVVAAPSSSAKKGEMIAK